jgi:hypothetical protein
LFLQLVFYLVWSTYPAGMTDNKCGINQSINILIYSNNTERYDKLVDEVVERLAKNELVISRETYVWAETEFELLGYIIIPDGMRMAKDKVEAI